MGIKYNFSTTEGTASILHAHTKHIRAEYVPAVQAHSMHVHAEHLCHAHTRVKYSM